MTLEELQKVDCIGIEKSTGQAVLTITDAWPWDDELQHLLLLQNKLNAYLGFIESGEIWEAYPLAQGKQLRIDIEFLHPPTDLALQFLARASEVASEYGVLVEHHSSQREIEE